MPKRKLQFYIETETYEKLRRLKDQARYPYAETIRIALALLFTGEATESAQAIRKTLDHAE